MPRGPEKANEFKRYRQILAALYIAVIALGFLLLAASVVKELFFRPVVQLDGPTLSAENPSPEDLLRCHNDVVALFTKLDRQATRLITISPDTASAPDQKEEEVRDVIGEWEQFSRGWLTEWDQVNAYCRFSELEDANMGAAYDRMARVHATLPTMRLKYQSLLVRFDDEQTAELFRMRRDLRRAKELLIREQQGASEEQAP